MKEKITAEQNFAKIFSALDKNILKDMKDGIEENEQERRTKLEKSNTEKI